SEVGRAQGRGITGKIEDDEHQGREYDCRQQRGLAAKLGPYVLRGYDQREPQPLRHGAGRDSAEETPPAVPPFLRRAASDPRPGRRLGWRGPMLLRDGGSRARARRRAAVARAEAVAAARPRARRVR